MKKIKLKIFNKTINLLIKEEFICDKFSIKKEKKNYYSIDIDNIFLYDTIFSQGITKIKEISGEIEYWTIDQYIKQWQNAFLFLEKYDYTYLIINIIRGKKRKKSFENINIIGLYKIGNFIAIQETHHYNSQLKEDFFLKFKNITPENWEKIILKKNLLIDDCDSFFVCFDEKIENGYLECEKFISIQNNFIVVSNYLIKNIKIGISTIKDSIFKSYNGYLFLNSYIIKFKLLYSSWNIDNYTVQWNNALNDLIKNPQSCFVINIQKSLRSDSVSSVALMCMYKVYPYIIINTYYIGEKILHGDRTDTESQRLDKILGKFSEIKFDDFYKLIPPLRLTKKSEYIVIDDLIET
jgi:hypothetical protein